MALLSLREYPKDAYAHTIHFLAMLAFLLHSIILVLTYNIMHTFSEEKVTPVLSL